MKIAHLMQFFDVGGIERFVQMLAERHTAAGHRVTVGAYVRDGQVRAALEAAGIEATFFDGPEDGIRWRLPHRLARWLRQNGTDVLHTHHVGPFLYGSMAARRVGISHVHTEHSVELYTQRRYRAIARTMPRLAAVVGVGDAVTRWRQSELADRAVRTIPNGTPVPPLVTEADRQRARAALGLEPGALVVGCVARLAPEKDHATLIRAFQRVVSVRDDARLLLVGDGPQRGHLESMVSRAALWGRVDFLGARDDVERILRAVDIAALASTREGMPLAALEALAHGLPLVATRVGSIPQLLEDGGGVLCDVGDWEALARAILALESPDARAELGRRGRRTIERSYSARRTADAYLQLYRRVAEPAATSGQMREAA
jgi:glycosyltransferase involved in cell wall biosynthesis